ncbi:glyceraldehyde-3-phosphate dehydrogenase [Nocardioides humilatus]|uniref:Glyceraldehyde-3-phosphate dehydrogenase n=1 Tax=Nocardioides humilatus TaxID=2607660 RepID=A0A5B1L907_9ACTN|nr:glyceraldehyde-3-phosphate dehydrogenase [Nocardioides humilatus]KAA1416916.1 glyceraldehyde-3-phosphate dehydrogenase [Nocardioides humilatus]
MPTYEETLADWNEREAVAEASIPLIGALNRDKGVTVVLHSRSLVDKDAIRIIKTHRFARRVSGEELSVRDTFPFLEAVSALDISSVKIDLARLHAAYDADGRGLSIPDFVADALSDIAGDNKPGGAAPRDVVLYGFGRIGRLVTRLLVEKAGAGNGLRLRAIVVRGGGEGDLAKRASLLRRDSVHGQFNGTIQVDEANNIIIANGTAIQVIYAGSPDEIDYTAYGIDDAILVDNTGVWRDRAGLERHLRPGIAKVLLTAPGKGDIPNIVHGVNHLGVDADEKILSCASCTTNAIVPTIKAMDDQFGLIRAHVETVHSYTNDQNLLDNYHKADRRGRSAPINMVLTATGASSAVKKVLPDLEASISGNSIRVPTPDVSMAILSLQLKTATDRDQVLAHLRQTSLEGPLSRCLDYTTANDAVSSDFVGSRASSIIDANAALVDGDQAMLYVWYDNEFGYSCQVVRVVQSISGVEYPTYPLGG